MLSGTASVRRDEGCRIKAPEDPPGYSDIRAVFRIIPP